jgi:hypothetical protein
LSRTPAGLLQRHAYATLLFARQPTVENVTTESGVLYCPSNVTPEAVFEYVPETAKGTGCKLPANR